MFIRSELKEKAKLSIHKNIWLCIGVTLVYSLLARELFGVEVDLETNEMFFRMGLGSTGSVSLDFVHIAIPTTIVTIVSLASLAFQFFVVNPIIVGHKRFYLENRIENSYFESLFFAFNKNHYLNIVKVMLLYNFYTFLWTLCFIIPGIIKTYEYRMIPYLLAENPTLDSEVVFSMTKEMTNGYKMDLFILDLSFILWDLFGTITCGIGQLYVNVYVEATGVEAYIFLKETAYGEENIDVEVNESEEVEYVEPTIDDLH